MTDDDETITRLQARMMQQQEEVRILRKQQSQSDSRIDTQRKELARLHAQVAELKMDKANLLKDLREMKNRD